MKYLKKQKGITLVALVVTVVILLILAGVSLNLILGDQGIIRKANEGRTNYTNASEEEHALLNRLSDDLDAYARGQGGNTPTVLNTATTNQNGIQISLSISGTNIETPPMPDATFQHVEGTTIANGYVITDGMNEFVWIPVAKDQVITLDVQTEEDIESITLYNPYGNQLLTVSGSSLDNKTQYETEIETYGNANCINGTYKAVVTTENNEKNASLFVTSLYAKLGLKDYYMSDDYAITQEIAGVTDIDALSNAYGYSSVQEMYESGFKWIENCIDLTETDENGTRTIYSKSINDNGGFYVARYEAGISKGTKRTSGSGTNDNETYEAIKNASGVPVSAQGVYQYNHVTQLQAKYLAESMYTGKSSLITGASWDRVLGFIMEHGTGSKNISQVAGNSNTWGNYIDSTSPANVTGYGSLQLTGFSSNWQAKNIFDIAGNTFEITLEIYGRLHSNSWRGCMGSELLLSSE